MKDSSSLVFTGDIGFDKHMNHKWEDEDLIDSEIMAFLHEADHVVVNVEGALVEQKESDRELVHTMNPKAISVLKKMRTDIWNLCNNHIMDAGEKGIENTLKLARLHQVQTIGAGMNIAEARRPIYLNEAGGIGIFSLGYRRGCKPAGEDKAGCYLWNEMELIQESIQEIKKLCKWCVLVVHGGEEFTSLPSPYTRNRYLTYLDMGADVIVAHHPHVPMNYEIVGDKMIFYSLGNFIFDTDYQRSQFNTEFGEVVRLHFTKEKMTWEAKGIFINRKTGRIEACPLPSIFQNVNEKEYRLLLPLAAKMMVAAYKRQLLYQKPDEFKNASEEKWKKNFLQEKRSGRVPGEVLDFQIIYPLSLEAEKREWEKSSLEDVKKYILEQL
ncbi:MULTISPECIES: CapA family protein [Terrabacteria group]|uniref:CapA family protein n=1 Tax=Bacillati TaxID=1783272 RepID=UPI001C6EF281|nr:MULTISPECIES: CapA family protein [Terrabacteria group]MBW9212588.1 CapA family protein [Trueperella sp. zg.1013]